MNNFKLFFYAFFTAFLSGCDSPEVFSTADYLGFNKNYVKVTALETDSVQTSYAIKWNATNVAEEPGGYGALDYSIYIARTWDSPVLERAITVKDSEVTIHAITQASFPAKFKSADDFPDPDRGSYSNFNTNVTVEYDGVQYRPCIWRTGQNRESVHCAGMGMINKSSLFNGESHKEDLIWYSEEKQADLEDTVAKQIDLARVLMLPENEQPIYKQWLGVCPDYVRSADHSTLPPIRLAASCSCVYLKGKEYVQTITEFPDVPAPLGNGSDASRFAEIVLACATPDQS